MKMMPWNSVSSEYGEDVVQRKSWLNDVFDIHRNEKIIKLIKEKADDYDMELKQKADSLMQNNLQNKKNK